MSNIDKGGPAFPVHSVSWKEKDGTECVAIGTCGMTLRDYFAGQALAGICASSPSDDCTNKYIAAESYGLADAMLAAREGKQ